MGWYSNSQKEVVNGLVSQDRWDKMRRIGAELQEMESSEKDGRDNSKMESIRGLLVYMSRTYWDMNP